MSFRDFIKAATPKDTPRGDFIRDAQADPAFPDVASSDELVGYLTRRGACAAAIDVAKRLWRDWEKSR